MHKDAAHAAIVNTVSGSFRPLPSLIMIALATVVSYPLAIYEHEKWYWCEREADECQQRISPALAQSAIQRKCDLCKEIWSQW